jgi:hypothetical protein
VHEVNARAAWSNAFRASALQVHRRDDFANATTSAAIRVKSLMLNSAM